MDEQHVVKILSIEDVTHNVRAYRLEKPPGYVYEPGQATEISINKDEWREEKRPFTFTGLNEWSYLEFTIKSYHDHDGVTHELSKVRQGDELIIRDVWGAISYKGEGVFIAGGAGITPFIAILRQLYKEARIGENRLLFSNKTSEDIIYQKELREMLGSNARYILTQEQGAGITGHIDEALLKREIKDFSIPFYVCGPDKMVTDINEILKSLGANPESIVFEH